MNTPIELTIKEPLQKVIDEPDFLEAALLKKFSGFRAVGSNVYGIRRRDVSSLGVTDAKKGNVSLLHELGPKGIHEHRFLPGNFHIIASGTPHRVPYNFGYWHITDMEELSIKFAGPPGETGYSIVVMRTPVGSEGESYAWYCQQCFTLLYETPVRTGELGLREFWRKEIEGVRTYNGDRALRTCPDCGHVNPLAYTSNTSKDTPEEAAARTTW